ncbi:heme exporter protein CcmD [Rheinheimera texasensis]|uniref:heme exporter protein CcmD n=1 Tax=Rheinheimera texasensis TaxID=306205 RepID=UPI0004E10017|nr:heme exporter protein CcmD [Rheinheimera texasensis]
MPQFNFASFADFLAMGGYGFFVWLSFGGSVAALLALGLYSKRQQQRFIQQQASRAAREDRVRQHTQEQQ